MKVVSLTTVFPNVAQPMHGVFVYERLRHLERLASLRVVAPVLWRVRGATRVPKQHARTELLVAHPRFVYVPGVLKALDGTCLFLSALGAMRRVRREFDFDLIDAHFAFPEGFAAGLFARWFDRPYTITMRGTEILLARDPFRRQAIRWALRHADRVIAVAEPLAQFALSMGVDPARVTVIANGVDTAAFAPMPRSEARHRLGVSGNGPLIVSVGHLSERKGFQRVVRVLPALLRDHPGAMLTVVGGAGAEPSNEAALLGLVRELGLEEHVRFAGAQPPAAVAQWLNAADLFVLASDYEGCPNVVLEALACGRPVVATRVGNVDRMLPAYAGILFDDPENDGQLLDALGRALRTRWDSERIRSYAEGLSWSDVATRVHAQWLLALEQRHPSAGGRREAERHLEIPTHEETTR